MVYRLTRIQRTRPESMEAVSLHFKNIYSGILFKTIDSLKSYIKYGSMLSYAQTYNRIVTATIYLPYTEQWVEKSEPIRFDFARNIEKVKNSVIV